MARIWSIFSRKPRPVRADDPRTITLTFNQWKRVAYAVHLELHHNENLGKICSYDPVFRKETEEMVAAFGPYNEWLRIWGENHLKKPLTTP